MRQYTIASALLRLYHETASHQVSIWRAGDEDADSPAFVRVASAVPVQLQQLTGEERVAAGAMDYGQRLTHWGYCDNKFSAHFQIGYRLTVVFERDQWGQWQPVPDDCDPPALTTEIIGKEYVPANAGVNEQVRLLLAQVSVTR